MLLYLIFEERGEYSLYDKQLIGVFDDFTRASEAKDRLIYHLRRDVLMYEFELNKEYDWDSCHKDILTERQAKTRDNQKQDAPIINGNTS